MIRLNHKRSSRLNSLLRWSPQVAIKKGALNRSCLAAAISAGLVLMTGCQSTPTAATPQNRPSIDFSRIDNANTSAQSRAFHEVMPNNTAEYQALFAQSGAVNSEKQAKLRLVAAMSQHLTTPHWSSTQVRSYGAPFVSEGSIDHGADSIFKSLLDVYLYRLNRTIEALTAESDDAEQVVENIAQEVDAAAEAADSQDDNYAIEDDSDYDRNIFGITNLNPFQLLHDYAEMRNQKASSESLAMLPNVLSLLKRTPEQIAAKNNYQNQYLTINTLSRFDPKQKQFQSVLSYDYLAPTMSSSVQLPIAVDFARNRLRVDPAAMMPLVALMNPENALLPKDMAGKTIDFHLTENMRAGMPTSVIYDAVTDAFLASISELDATNFTPVDITEDKFAKDLRATRAIKINADAKFSGKLIGIMMKHLTKSLNDYVKANPKNTDENKALQDILTKMALYNEGYQSADVGSLVQLIEAIAPIDFNNSNYYYLDANNRLVGKQQRLDVGSGLFDMRNQILSQSRFEQDLSRHPLAPLLSKTFDAAATGIDGNAWLNTIRQDEYRKSQARYARYDYGLEEAGLMDDYSSNIVIDELPNSED